VLVVVELRFPQGEKPLSIVNPSMENSSKHLINMVGFTHRMSSTVEVAEKCFKAVAVPVRHRHQNPVL
jgi:hypothetical protein